MGRIRSTLIFSCRILILIFVISVVFDIQCISALNFRRNANIRVKRSLDEIRVGLAATGDAVTKTGHEVYIDVRNWTSGITDSAQIAGKNLYTTSKDWLSNLAETGKKWTSDAADSLKKNGESFYVEAKSWILKKTDSVENIGKVWISDTTNLVKETGENIYNEAKDWTERTAEMIRTNVAGFYDDSKIRGSQVLKLAEKSGEDAVLSTKVFVSESWETAKTMGQRIYTDTKDWISGLR